MKQVTFNCLLRSMLSALGLFALVGCMGDGDSSSPSSSSTSSSSTSSSSSSSGYVTPSKVSVKFLSIPNISVLEGNGDTFYQAEIVGLASDTGPDIWYEISGPDQEHFLCDSGTGAIAFSGIPMMQNPQDANGDNIYNLTLTVSSISNEFDSQSMDLAVEVVGAGQVDVNDLEVIFPPEGSNLAYGVDTDLEVSVRVNLDSGDHANIASITANGNALTASSLEQGLWLGFAPISTGPQVIQYELTQSDGNTLSFSSVVNNNAVIADYSGSAFSSNGDSLYVFDSEQASIFKVDTVSGAVSVVSGPLRGTGPAMTSTDYSSTVVLDEVNETLYMVLNSILDGPFHAISIDLQTGDRASEYPLPEEYILIGSSALMVDAATGDLIVFVYDKSSSSKKLLRINDGESTVMFDSANLAAGDKVCGSESFTIDSTTGVAFVATNNCGTGNPTVISIDLGNGAVAVVASSTDSLPGFRDVEGVVWDSVTQQLSLFSPYGPALYQANLADKSLTTLVDGGNSYKYSGSAFVVSSSNGPTIFDAGDGGFKKASQSSGWETLYQHPLKSPNLYAVNDLDFNAGTLAMVSGAQVYLWDPTDLFSQQDWVNMSIQNGNYPTTQYYQSHFLGGIELEKNNDGYWVYQLNQTRGDFLFSAEIEQLWLDFDGNIIERTTIVERHSRASGVASTRFRIDSAQQEVFFSTSATIDSLQEYYSYTKGDASVENEVGIYVKNNEVGETYLASTQSRVLTSPLVGGSSTDYIAVTHDAKNHIAYALSGGNQSSYPVQSRSLYAISLIGGQRVLMGGAAAPEHSFTSQGSSSSTSLSSSSSSSSGS